MADRWHLLKNLGEAIQGVLEANREVLKQAALDLAQGQLPAKTLPDVVVSPSNEAAPTSHRDQSYQQVKGYQAAGHSVRWVTKQTGLARNTVRKYWRWSVFQAKTRCRCTPICQYEAHLRQRWQQGQQHLPYARRYVSWVSRVPEVQSTDLSASGLAVKKSFL